MVYLLVCTYSNVTKVVTGHVLLVVWFYLEMPTATAAVSSWWGNPVEANYMNVQVAVPRILILQKTSILMK